MVKRKKTVFFPNGRLFMLAVAFFLVAIFVVKEIKLSKWDGLRRFTIVVDSNPLYIFSIEPSTNTAIIVLIPPNTTLDVPYNYNGYQAKAIYSLGNLDTKRGGGKLLIKSIENTFGVFTDGFIAAKDDKKFTVPEDPDKIYQFKKNNFSSVSFLPSIVKIFTGDIFLSDLSRIDLIRLWFSIHNLRGDQIIIVNLDKGKITRDEKLPDGTMVKIVDKDLFDLSMQTNFQDQKIRMQNITIDIVNAANKQSVAAQFSRMLMHLGAKAVAKSTADTLKDLNCNIYIFEKRLLSSIIVLRILNTYKCGVQQTNEGGIADIKIVLGEKFIK